MHRDDAGTSRLDVPAQIPAALSSMAASSAVAEAAAGPARIERSGEADPVAARPLARADDNPKVHIAVRAPASAAHPAAAAARRTTAKPSTTVIAVAPPKAVHPRPAAARTTGSPATAHGDPDVTLLSAMLARLSGDADAAAASPRPTIAQLVERCEVRPIKDSIEAFECKRRICAGYWGKADACPMSLAPKKS